MDQETLKNIIESSICYGIDIAGNYTEPNWTVADAMAENAKSTVIEQGGTDEQAADAGSQVWEGLQNV